MEESPESSDLDDLIKNIHREKLVLAWNLKSWTIVVNWQEAKVRHCLRLAAQGESRIRQVKIKVQAITARVIQGFEKSYENKEQIFVF